MEIWFNTDEKKVRLPVLPAEIYVNGGIIDTSLNMANFGEVSVFGGGKIADGEINCFFPAEKNIKNYTFLQYSGLIEPYAFVDIFLKWMYNNQTLHFVITPRMVNVKVKITSFEWGEKDGSGDVYYTLKWKQVREMTIKKMSSTSSSSSNNTDRKPSETKDNTSSSSSKSHTVKSGDSLYKIAKQYLGSGESYPKIVEKNKTKYPSLVKNPSYIVNGWVLLIP